VLREFGQLSWNQSDWIDLMHHVLWCQFEVWQATHMTGVTSDWREGSMLTRD
jgi:hypothetical protein